MSTSYSWEGKGWYGSFRLRIESVGVQVKLWDPSRRVPYLSAAEMMIYEEALYHSLYVPLPFLPLNIEITERAAAYRLRNWAVHLIQREHDIVSIHLSSNRNFDVFLVRHLTLQKSTMHFST